MDSSKNIKYYNELDEVGKFETPLFKPRRQKSSKLKNLSREAQLSVQPQDDSRKMLSFTYKAARFEEDWLLGSIGHFYEQQWISDILAKIKVGKEASVYLCRSGTQVHEPLLAAKIYRPPMLRSLKKDHVYRLGRTVLDEDGNAVVDHGMLKALHNRSQYGIQIQLQSWIAHEYKTLQRLHACGADVPRPYEMGGSAILLAYLGDENRPAATLNTVHLPKKEIQPLFHQVLWNIRMMLRQDIVHADLSAFNLLYLAGSITLIDFPQVISANEHPDGFRIFVRDITRVCEYFNQQGLAVDPASLAAELWQEAGFKLRKPVHPALLDAEDPIDRLQWERENKHLPGQNH